VNVLDKLRIAICDENERDAEGYARICRTVCQNGNVPAELKIYTNNFDFMFDLGDDAFSTLLSILIVEPEGGFADSAIIAREKGYDGLILYLSHSTVPERYHQAFDAEAFNFVQKVTDSQTLARFQAVFSKALEAAKQLERQYIVLSCAGEYRQIEIRDIHCFEAAAAAHMIRVEYDGGSFDFPSTLQKLEERLRGRGFVRTHRSYIVAIQAVRRLEPNEVILSGDSKVPVSRSYYAALKSAMDRWEL